MSGLHVGLLLTDDDTKTDDTTTRQAVERLMGVEQRQLVGLCLRAMVEGPYVPEWEFQTIMGVERAEAAEVAESWPEPASNGKTFVTVNNTLNNFLGYPHGRWGELSQYIGADQQQVADALMAWRGPDRSTKTYFEAMM